jgi:hypothetical protein
MHASTQLAIRSGRRRATGRQEAHLPAERQSAFHQIIFRIATLSLALADGARLTARHKRWAVPVLPVSARRVPLANLGSWPRASVLRSSDFTPSGDDVIAVRSR